MTQPIPDGFHTLTPHLVLKDAAKGIDFYKKAFGAEEVRRREGPGGHGIMHAELKIGDSHLIVCDEFPQMERWLSPDALSGTTVCLHMYVEDVDRAFEQATKAGAKVSMPVMDTFWGDRYGKLTDPFGHEWSISTHIKDLTDDEIAAGAEKFFSQF